jgi:hypothetical protein
MDAVTGKPVRGDSFPYGFVQLMVMSPDEWQGFDYVNSMYTDAEGRFQFDSYSFGNRLQAGTYALRFWAEGYQYAEDLVFEAESGDLDLGDIPLTPNPISFSETQPCAEIPSGGGSCAFSVRVTNQVSEALDGAAWSVVFSYRNNSFTGSTQFQAGLPQALRLNTGESRVVKFSFPVPASLQDGAVICASIYVGQGRPNPLFNVVGAAEHAFCVTKGPEGYSLLKEESLRSLRLLERVGVPPRRQR